MGDEAFTHDVFLSHSAKDKAVVRRLAERLRKDGLKVWFDEWVLKPGDSIPAKIEGGLEHSRVLVLCMSANAFGSDWAQLEAGTFRFRDPLNKERRFIPLRLDDAPIKGSLAQFLYINWLLAAREQEYAKLLEACRNPEAWPSRRNDKDSKEESPSSAFETRFPNDTDYLRRRRDCIEAVSDAFEVIHAFFFDVCVDYMSLVEILHGGLPAADDVRKRYSRFIEQIGREFRTMHLLEGRLALAGADNAVRMMQQYRFQATEVNDMLRLQLPCKKKSEVEAVTNELFRRKDRLYVELAKALKTV